MKKMVIGGIVVVILGLIITLSINSRSSFTFSRSDFSININSVAYGVDSEWYQDGGFIKLKDRSCITWDGNPYPVEINVSSREKYVYWASSIQDYVKKTEYSGRVIKPVATRKISGRDFYVIEKEDERMTSQSYEGDKKVATSTVIFKNPIHYVYIEGDTIMDIEIQKEYCNYQKKLNDKALDDFFNSIEIKGEMDGAFVHTGLN